MDDREPGTDGADDFVRRVREAVERREGMELVRVDTDGPEVSVVVDVYAVENGERKLVERSLYDVTREPSVPGTDKTEEISEDADLHWRYIGSVDGSEDDEPNTRDS